MFPTKSYGIIGYPIGHSLSPNLHNWAFSQAGWPGVYFGWKIAPEKLEDFFRAFRVLPISGCNITIPHKVNSIAYIDEISDAAKKIGSINTLYWREDKLVGENTDIIGFTYPLKGSSFKHALVLGAGGAARAIVTGLKELKIPSITITNRTYEKARQLADFFDIEIIPWNKRMDCEADLIVNTTSLGMKGPDEDLTPYNKEWLQGRSGLVYDIIYTPIDTPLIKDAEEAGWKTENGLTMFIQQAIASFALWTNGLKFPAEEAAKLISALLK